MDLTTVLMAAALLAAGALLGYRLGRTQPRSADSATAVGALLGTAGHALERVEGQLREIERDRVGAYSALREQVAALHRTSAELSQQTRTLSGALRTPHVRGRWGEIQLERIVELAGMTEHCDFNTQVTVADEFGAPIARPDLVVRLSGDRAIPVDAKAPFSAWLEAMDCGDGIEADRLLLAHARAVRAHVDALAAKAYWRHFQPAPEFVVMFIPGEPLLDAALVRDPGLADYAFSRNVVLATPTTLITLLRTVAFSWRQETLGVHAAEVHRLGRELHQRLGVLGEHVERLGASLGKAVEHFNGTVASLESRVLVTARRFTDLQSGPELTPPPQIEHTPRRIQAPELLDHRPDLLGRDGQPDLRGRDQRPDLRGRVGQPDLRGRDQRPDLLGRDGQPDLRGRDQRPDLLGRDGQPDLRGRDQRPDLSSRGQRPDLLGRDQRPDLLGVDSQPDLLGRSV